MSRYRIRSACLLLGVILFCTSAAFASLPDPLSVSWEAVGTLNVYSPEPIGYTFDNEIGYFFGRTLGTSQNSRFNFTSGTWTALPDLPTAITYPCVVLVPNGDLYIIGVGITWDSNSVPNATVYKLAAGSSTYTTMAELNVARFQHSCAYDATTNRIYAIGGTPKTSGYPLLSGEYYSVDDDSWTMIANRTDDDGIGFSVINVGDGNLYTFNGNAGKKRILQYSIKDDTWTTIGAMNIGNYGQTAAFYEEENVIFLFGGYSSAGGCQYFNLTSKTLVEFTCLEGARNISITGTYGAFIPATRTFFYIAVYIQQLYTGNITLAASPMASPITQPQALDTPTTPTAPDSPRAYQPITEGQAPKSLNAPISVPSSKTSDATMSSVSSAMLIVFTSVSSMLMM